MAIAVTVESIGKELFDHITKALALFVSITYMMGLIIVNSFLLKFGIRTTTLLNTEYIAAGLPLALLFVVAGLTGAFFSRSNQRIGTKIGVMLLSLVTLSLMMFYITNLADYLKTLRTMGVFFLLLLLTFFMATRDFGRRLIDNRDKFFVWSVAYGVLFLAMMVALSTWYGRAVYDDILPTIGGGAGSTISFITDVESGKVLGELVPMQNEFHSEQVHLIRETSDSYFIALVDETSVSVDKDLIKGVIHHRRSGWETTPAMLD